MPLIATHEGICKCIKEPRGKGGMEGYDLDEKYIFRRMKRITKGGHRGANYLRVYHSPNYYETCGPVEFMELFSVLSESDQIAEQQLLMNRVFTNCNVCGIPLRTADEDQMGMCERCAAE
jgi:hypothetical protein